MIGTGTDKNYDVMIDKYNKAYNVNKNEILAEANGAESVMTARFLFIGGVPQHHQSTSSPM